MEKNTAKEEAKTHVRVIFGTMSERGGKIGAREMGREILIPPFYRSMHHPYWIELEKYHKMLYVCISISINTFNLRRIQYLKICAFWIGQNLLKLIFKYS